MAAWQRSGYWWWCRLAAGGERLTQTGEQSQIGMASSCLQERDAEQRDCGPGPAGASGGEALLVQGEPQRVQGPAQGAPLVLPHHPVLGLPHQGVPSRQACVGVEEG